jgi:cobalt-zinc-cadmium efflux system outer membrane protein
MRMFKKVARLRTFLGLLAGAAAAIAWPMTEVAAQESADSAVHRLKGRIRAASPALAARSAALAMAQARRAAAGYLAPAMLSAEVEEVPSFANVADAQSLRLDVSRELLPAGQRRAQRTLADLEVQRAAREIAVAAQLIDATIDALVVRAAGNAAIASRLASEDSVLRGAEEAVRARFAVADARYVDVLRLRTERLRVETEQRTAGAEYAITRGQLLRLAPPTDSAGLAALVDSVLARVARRILAAAPAPLPSIDSLWAAAGARELLELDVQRADAAITAARAAARATLSPTLGVQRFGELGESKRFGLVAGIAITLPFTASAANRSRVVAAERELDFARTQRTAVESQLGARLAVAADRYAVALSQLAAYDSTLLRGARDEREAALASYRSGSVSLIELLDFERALAQAEVSRIRSRIAAAEALMDYVTSAITLPDTGDLR